MIDIPTLKLKYNKLTHHELNMVSLLYSEIEQAQFWIQKHTDDANDRDPVNENYSRELISNWEFEKDKLQRQLKVFQDIQTTKEGIL